MFIGTGTGTGPGDPELILVGRVLGAERFADSALYHQDTRHLFRLADDAGNTGSH